MKKLSVIIPMYNSSAFIEKAVSSILQSSLEKEFYDILIIDDGSTDDSLNIVQRLSLEFDNIKVITQENGGAGMARNTGIKYADSEYIWFFDSDDAAEKNLDVIPTRLKKYKNIDIFSYRYNWIQENNEIIGIGNSQQSIKCDKVFSGREVILQGYKPGSVCGLIIRTNFLRENGLCFRSDITQEDSEFTYRMFALASQVLFSTSLIYNYLLYNSQRNNPLGTRLQEKYYLDTVEVAKSFKELALSFLHSDNALYMKINNYADSVLFGIVWSILKGKIKGSVVRHSILQKMKEYGFYPLGQYKDWRRNLLRHLLNSEFLLK